MAISALPAIASVATVIAAGTIVLSVLDLGPLSAHMALHIAAMNVTAPLLAIACMIDAGKIDRGAALWVASAVQVTLLWAWHAPSVQRAMMGPGVLQDLAHVTLFLAALLFWTLLLNLSATARWQAIFPLLLTGKLTCLLGALLVFAPRQLYAVDGHPHHASAIADLSDQQLAGLLMITACPLSYVVAGVVLATQIMAEITRSNGAGGARKLIG